MSLQGTTVHKLALALGTPLLLVSVSIHVLLPVELDAERLTALVALQVPRWFMHCADVAVQRLLPFEHFITLITRKNSVWDTRGSAKSRCRALHFHLHHRFRIGGRYRRTADVTLPLRLSCSLIVARSTPVLV